MPALSHITDHAARAVARLVSQFKDSTEVKGFLTALAVQVQAAEDALYQVLVFRDVANATGVTLDRIGALVEAPTRGNLDDASYRRRVRAQILSNRSEGDCSDLFAIINAIYPVAGSAWEIRDQYFVSAVLYNFDGSVNVRMTDDGKAENLAGNGFPDTATARECERFLEDSAAGGVRPILFYRLQSIDPNRLFRCAGGSPPETAAGLGSGKLLGSVDHS